MADEMIGGALSSINPIKSTQIGSLSTFASIFLVIAVATIIFILVLIVIWIYFVKNQYWINIKVYRNIGNTPTQVATYKAKETTLGFAGDKLWRVAPNSPISMAFKVIKWLPVGKYQSAPKEFLYWIRSDGEWINFKLTDIDGASKQMKVEFVQEDMRLQRLATEKILEQRLLNVPFWEKYGVIIGYTIFFLVITIAMIIIFYQWSGLIEEMKPLVEMITEAYAKAQASCNSQGGLIPV